MIWGLFLGRLVNMGSRIDRGNSGVYGIIDEIGYTLVGKNGTKK